MQIILMCKEESVTSALHAEQIAGLQVPDRWYAATNHVMTLSGWPVEVLRHDADELLNNPIFRLPTFAEQDQLAQEAQRANTVQESEQGDVTPPDLESPPARQEKASGG